MKQSKHKKGQMLGGFNTLLSLAFIIAIFGFILSFTSGFMADEKADVGEDACADRDDGYTTYVGDGQCNNGAANVSVDSTAYSSVDESLKAQLDLAESQGTVVGAGILFVVLAILIGIYAFYQRSQGR